MAQEKGVRLPGSSVFRRVDLARKRGAVERTTAWIVLALSFIGSAVALGGGWSAVVTLQASLAGIGAGVLLQFLLTWLQWAYGDDWRLAWASRAVDAGLTAAGYGPLVAPVLQAALVAQGAAATAQNVVGFEVVPAAVATWAILFVFSLLPAWYPESRLID